MSREDGPRSARVTADPSERAREVALRLLTHAPRSAAQLRDGLVSRDVDDALAEEIVERYRDVGLIDDPELAATIARTRHRERGQSRGAIRRELSRKGFERDDVEGALAQISDDDERDAALALASRRWNTLRDAPREARVRRVVGMLGRKGYPPDLAFDLVRRLERADIVDGREDAPSPEE